MIINSPVGHFPFDLIGARPDHGKIRIKGAMGAWPINVEVQPSETSAYRRMARAATMVCRARDSVARRDRGQEKARPMTKCCTEEPRRLVAVSLKAYFGFEGTIRWLAELDSKLRAKPLAHVIEITVLPSYPLLERAVLALGPHGVTIGAQDVSSAENGPHTGEVTASVLAEIGCRYAEVGHADRRRLVGDNDDVVADRAAAAVRHGLIPLVCVGETDRMSSNTAAKHVVRQTIATLERLPVAEVVIAYEPSWAIGADVPADTDHVIEIGGALRDYLATSGHSARILYGGAAGPGTLIPLAADFDGLFLGRRAHHIDSLLAVAAEACAAPSLSPRQKETR